MSPFHLKMNILEKIIAYKRQEVAQRRQQFPVEKLEQSPHFHRSPISLVQALRQQGASGVIAEFKRKSPSKGWLNEQAEVEKITAGYVQAGASALSVLTDEPFFGGKNAYLTAARQVCNCPILRKDFIVDEYQLLEAKAIGADVILLIAACLSPAEVKKLGGFARSLGLEVLLEIHEAAELDRLCEAVDLVGVNNRNLHDFTVDVQRSLEILPLLPADLAKISESGLSNPAVGAELKAAGFDGLLIGETFMRQSLPELACREFVQAISTAKPTFPKVDNFRKGLPHPKLKVCGMRDPHNINSVLEAVSPDYLGFIFYPKSKRYAGDTLPPEFARNLTGVEKVGVFVNETEAGILKTVENFRLDLVQLHGNESPIFCKRLKNSGLRLVKAFQIHPDFDFQSLAAWQPWVDFFLFDAPGEQRGGNGLPFDWSLLKNYQLPLPYFLAGGISPENVFALRSFFVEPSWEEKLAEEKMSLVFDLNSRFEISPGIKNPALLKKFKHELFG